MLLDLWAKSIGGIENLSKITAVYQKMSVKMAGLSGILEEWITIQGQHCLVLDLGIYKMTTIFDGKTAWVKNQNGLVRELVDFELENELTAIYLATFSQFLGHRPGIIEEKDYLIVKPDGGKPVSVFFNENHLPIRYEQFDEGRIRTTFFDDWRKINGILFAHRIYQDINNATFAIEMIEINPFIDQGMFKKPVESTLSPFITGTDAKNVPFIFNNNHIYLQIEVNSELFWFLFDTGAGSSVIDINTAKTLGLKPEGELEGRGTGEKSVDVALVNLDLSLSNIRIRQTIAAIGLESFIPYEGYRIDGILGYDFINQFAIEIDYANKIISFYDPKTYYYEGNGENLAISLKNNVPHVQIKLSDGQKMAEGSFLIDTGANSTININKLFLDQHNLEFQSIDYHPGYGVGGESKRKIGRLPELQLEKFVLKDVIAYFVQDTKGLDADPSNAGLVGGRLLKCFRLILNYSQNYLILEPNDCLNEPFNGVFSGLFVVTDENLKNFYIDDVLKNSPADNVSLQEGDQIISLNEESINSFTLGQINDVLQNENPIKISVKRGDSIIETTLKPKKLI